MSKRHAREHGRILSVDEETLGSVLVADAASGATTLYVDDAAEFEDDGTGGWLSVNDQVIEYDTVDDDAGTIHLKTGLSAAADDGDPVYVWSKLYDTAATVKTALVMVDGEDDNTDPIHATLSDAVQDLPEGLRGEAGESCTLVRVSDDEWEVTAVGGAPSSVKGGKSVKFFEETFSITATGSQTLALTYTPIDHSEHVYWNGDYQPSSEWARDGKVVIVPDIDGYLEVGDELNVEYAYRVNVASSEAGALLSMPIGTAWKYKTGLGSSSTYAASGFDDSAWSTGPSGFGHGTLGEYVSVVNTPAGSNGNIDVWTRAHVETGGGRLRFYAKLIDFNYAIYLDGALITSGAANIFDVDLVTVDCPAGAHVIAAYCFDANASGSGGTNHESCLALEVFEER